MTQSRAGKLAKQLVPALATGIGSALVLHLMNVIAEDWLHDLIWDRPSFGDSRWWIFVVLTLAGVAVGLTIWLVPGHAGPDPATTGLMHPPSPLRVVPGLLLAAAIGLAAGVSLGPEFPILGANAAIAVALGGRLLPQVGKASWAGLATAGTLGALFGTPVAAALMLTESLADHSSEETLWDRLFAPLAAAAAGGLFAIALAGGSNSMSLSLPALGNVGFADILLGCAVSAVAALAAVGANLLFPRLYRLFQHLRHPLPIAVAGGVCLGLLGALGGKITLFKGLSQMADLAASYRTYTLGGLLAITAIKLLAMIIAGVTGFRGGRIFPAVFVAVAFGFTLQALVPELPVALAVACSALGFVMAVTRSGWMSIFLGAVLVPDPIMIVILAIAVLPAWLIVSGAPEMTATPNPATTSP